MRSGVKSCGPFLCVCSGDCSFAADVPRAVRHRDVFLGARQNDFDFGA